MDIRRRFLLLIHVLYCAVIIHGTLLDVNNAETCDVLCRYCNASAIFTNGQCECNFIGNNDEGTKCIQRIQGENPSVNLNILSNDLIDRERSIRAILKSRHHLRTGDAEKVAQYFINGGPSSGHSHFVTVFNTTYDSADSTINSFSGTTDKNDPENEFRDIQSYLPLSTSPIVENTYGSPLYMVPETAPNPAMPDVKSYTPILGMVNPVFGPLGELQDPLLGSMLHPYGHVSPLHALLRVADIPSQIVNRALAHRYSHYPLMNHDFVGNSLPQNNLPPISSFNNNARAYTNNDGSTDNDGSIVFKSSAVVRNNADENIGHGITSIPNERSTGPSYYPALMPYSLNQPYQFWPYEYLIPPYLYNSYQHLLNTLHPRSYGYQIPERYRVPSYSQSTSDTMLRSAPNTNSYCTNNVNEQKNEVPTSTDKIMESNDKKEEKTDKTTNINTFKDGKDEKNGKYNRNKLR